MKKRITLTVDQEIAAHAKALAKNQGISLSELFSRKFESLDEDQLKIQLAAKRFLDRMRNQPSIPTLNRSDNELIMEHRRKKLDES